MASGLIPIKGILTERILMDPGRKYTKGALAEKILSERKGAVLQNLIYSLNVTMPIFILMVLGYFLHSIGWIRDGFASKLNTFVFRLPLPLLVFQDLASVDIRKTWDGTYVLFCFLVTLFSILLMALLSKFAVKDKPRRGEFVQAAYRSSAALLGMAYISNMYQDTSMGPLMIVGAVPLYNVAAVVLLSVTAEDAQAKSGEDRSALAKRTIRNIFTNPILIGIFFGILWSLLRLPLSGIFATTISNVARTATPLGLIAMGASIRLKDVGGQLKPSLLAAFFKIVGLSAIFLPLAVMMGFRTQKLVSILVMLGSPTTVSCFVMAKNMGHDGALTANSVVFTTVLSSFTLTLWIWILKNAGLI